MGCGTSKVLPEPPKDVQLDLVKKVEPFSGTKSDVYKHFITEVDSVGPLKAGFPEASQGANPCPGAPTTGHTEPPSEPPRRARVAKYRAKFDPRVTAKYDIKALIGRGSFSRVVRVEHRATRQPYAIKMIETKYREGREVCESELRVLRRVRHANIIQLVEVFETQERVYMVMELATGGELFDRIIAKGSFTERDATRVLQMVLDGVRYLHALGITHRDLKPENLLYYHPGTDSKIIITDFGLASARKKGDDCLMKTTCGTPEYIAPEVLVRKPYTNSVDMWALGVIAYILLSGTMPFEDDNRTRLYRQILRGKYSYSGEFPDQGSNLCPLQWKSGILTTGLPGSSRFSFPHLAAYEEQNVTWPVSQRLPDILMWLQRPEHVGEAALAQRVQPGQGLHRPPADGGPRRPYDGTAGPEASVGGEHGSLFVYEESAPLHLPEPPQTRLLALPEHQICPVHAFQPLYTIQQVSPSAGARAAGAQPALPAAVQWLSCQAGVQTWHGPSLATHRCAIWAHRPL
ncbi:serine/threonine-protein kinase H1 isoform X1 [Balaenoptera ricei]|uniref:serine/threonine-protein kinase H1 isoform X1 n=1 Tax=Balaenoptera ricei TaxID=2746895 RepID=UPI0028BEA79B|nr:serine/threonine-protein kinase H1 isoform X1 [Balaenoptera ricei]